MTEAGLSLAQAIDDLKSTAEALKEARRTHAIASSKYQGMLNNVTRTWVRDTDWMEAKNDTIRKARGQDILLSSPDYQDFRAALDKAELELEIAKIDYDVAVRVMDLLASSLVLDPVA